MSKKITFITQYTRTPESIRDTSIVEFKEPSQVKESLSYATDINTIYDSYCKTGRLPLNGNQPIYDENFIKYDTLIEAQKAVSEACQYFQNLPTEIRNQYGNSLEKFVQALHSGDQFLLDKGVLKKKEIEKKEIELPEAPTTPVEKLDKPVVPVTPEKPTTPAETTA